jgi:LuxR family maltose regulon positive regulatory protein
LAYYLGQLDQAEALCRQWKVKFAEVAGSAPENVWKDIPATRGLDIVLSLLLMERNQLAEAEYLLVQALDLLGWASWMELHGFIILAHVRNMQGNVEGALETLHRMARRGPQHSACSEALQVLYALSNSPNDPQVRSRAEVWAANNVPAMKSPFALGIGPYHCVAEYFFNLAWSRIQIKLGHFQEAGVFISPALISAKAHGLPFRVAELSIEHSLIQDGLGNLSAALTELEIALDIGEKYGYIRVFDQSLQLDRLLQQAFAKNIHAQYVNRLLSSFTHSVAYNKNAIETAQPKNPGANLLVEPLSEREIEVLRHLADGLTPAEVAKRLYLSPHTLKAHTQNIYAKLDVHSRIEAINKAHGLGLI